MFECSVLWLPRRGVPGSVEGAEKLVRTDAVEDGTDGFFLAVFQRKGLF